MILPKDACLDQGIFVLPCEQALLVYDEIWSPERALFAFWGERAAL
jgi:hypothetical protein